MNCTNITVVSNQVDCINQSITSFNGTLQNNTHHHLLPTPYSQSELLARLIAYVCIMIPAFFGNVVVVISFIIDPNLRTKFNLFLLNMAIIDILTAIFRMGFNVATIALVHNRIRPYSWSLCQFNGFMQSLVHTTNVLTLLCMAVFRYLVVVHSKGHLVTNKSVLITIAITWILSLLEALAPIMGWNRYQYHVFEIACLPDWEHEKSFPVFVMVFVFAVPLVVMIYCYALIYWTVKKNSQRVRSMSHSGGNDNALEKISRRESKVTLAMFIVFATFIICFGPYCISMFILFPVFHIWVGKDVAFFCGWMVNFNSVINPLVYPCVNDRFKNAYKSIFCNCCRNNDTYSTTSSSVVKSVRYISKKSSKIADTRSPFTVNKFQRNGHSRSVYIPQECDYIYNDLDD